MEVAVTHLAHHIEAVLAVPQRLESMWTIRWIQLQPGVVINQKNTSKSITGIFSFGWLKQKLACPWTWSARGSLIAFLWAPSCLRFWLTWRWLRFVLMMVIELSFVWLKMPMTIWKTWAWSRPLKRPSFVVDVKEGNLWQPSWRLRRQLLQNWRSKVLTCLTPKLVDTCWGTCYFDKAPFLRTSGSAWR